MSASLIKERPAVRIAREDDLTDLGFRVRWMIHPDQGRVDFAVDVTDTQDVAVPRALMTGWITRHGRLDTPFSTRITYQSFREVRRCAALTTYLYRTAYALMAPHFPDLDQLLFQ